MSCVLHINGWPGSGKRTIGQLVAARLGGRPLDNHAMLNPAEALFEREDPLHQSLWDAVRRVTLDHAARLGPEVAVVVTDPLADEGDDPAVFEAFRELAAARGVRLLSVMLEIDAEENERRLAAPSRAEHRKLTRPEMLKAMRERYRLLAPEGSETLTLDVSALTADQAAAVICHWIEGAGPAS